MTLVLFRLLLSAVMLLSVTLLLRKAGENSPGDFKFFVALAFFEPFMYFMGEAYGMTMISSTVAAVIVSTIPLFAPIGAYFFHPGKVVVGSLLGYYYLHCWRVDGAYQQGF